MIAATTNGWQMKTIEDLKADEDGSIAIGPFGSRMKADCYVPNGVPVIRGNNLSDTRVFREEFVYVSDETADSMKTCNAIGDDLVFPHRGSIGEVGIVPNDQRRYMLSTSLMKLRCNRSLVNPLFLFYFFRSANGRHELLKNASTVGTPGIGQPLSSLRSITVPLPPRPLQDRIADILGTLDDKIELNRRTNETLEATVRTLFKSWFVDFDPVQDKVAGRKPAGLDAETARLFPSSFEHSPLASVPKGWTVGTFGDLADNPRRGIQAREILSGTSYIGLEHMPRRSIALSEWEDEANVESNKFAFRRGEILFGKLRPYFHKVGIAAVDGVCSTDILVVVPKQSDWFGLVLGHISSDEFIAHADAASSGTKMPRTNWNDMARYPVVIPPRALAAKYSELIRPMVESINETIHESRTLAATRDSLLPRLLNGEVPLNDSLCILKELSRSDRNRTPL